MEKLVGRAPLGSAACGHPAPGRLVGGEEAVGNWRGAPSVFFLWALAVAHVTSIVAPPLGSEQAKALVGMAGVGALRAARLFEYVPDRAMRVSFYVKSSCNYKVLDCGEQQRDSTLISFTLGLSLGMFRRITAAASRLFTADGADGSFYSLESLNTRVRCMIPTHPALVLLWCQILLLVSHTDYRWWAEVQQTPKYVRRARRTALTSSRPLALWPICGRLSKDPFAF